MNSLPKLRTKKMYKHFIIYKKIKSNHFFSNLQ